jgi:hypothetical protein
MNDINEQAVALLEIQRDIERAARHMHLEWPEVVASWEDMSGEMTMRLLQDNYAVTLRDMDPKPRRKTLTKIGIQIASGMRDDFERFSGNFRYSTNEVRDQLDKGALFCDDTSDMTVDLDRGAESDEWTPRTDAEGREVLGKESEVEPFDIRGAFFVLADHHQEMLIRKYVKREEMLTSNDRKKVQRAVDALTMTMNRGFRRAMSEHDGPGKRGVKSNGQALSLTRAEES